MFREIREIREVSQDHSGRITTGEWWNDIDVRAIEALENYAIAKRNIRTMVEELKKELNI